MQNKPSFLVFTLLTYMYALDIQYDNICFDD